MLKINKDIKIKDLWNKYVSYDEKMLRRLVAIATAMYFWLLVWALWFKFNDNSSVTLNYLWLSKMTTWERFTYDLIPFQIRYDHFNQIMQIFANSVIFAPFGVLLNMLFKKENIWRDAAICFFVSLGFELLQLFTLIGSFATADLIMNTAGYFIGLLVYRFIFKKLSVKFNVMFFLITNLLAFAVVVFSVIRTVIYIDPIIAILTKSI